MIDEIHIANAALMREGTFMPAPGLTVLTGESGAGKSCVLNAISLLCGGRASADMVSEGADALTVEGRFFAPDNHEGLVAARSVSADGRSRVRIDGALASVGTLAQCVGSSVDLCGQHEYQRLLKPAEHRRMLDTWLGEAGVQAHHAYREAFQAWKQALQSLDDLEARAQAGDDRVARARYDAQTIDAVAPMPGEYEELLADASRLEHAEAIVRTVTSVREALSTGSGSVLDVLGMGSYELSRMRGVDDVLVEQGKALQEATYLIEDVDRVLAKYAESDDLDPARLAAIQDRLAAFQGLLRSFGPTMDQVFAHRTACQDVLAAVDDYAELRKDAQNRLDRAGSALYQAGAALHELREREAQAFTRTVQEGMQRLEMQGAALACRVSLRPQEDWTVEGPDDVELTFCPGKDLAFRPLSRIASGGELSRVMLAIRLALGMGDNVDTIVFDEVDAGIGGTAAQALADVLNDLAESHQVIMVTHLAQVAACAVVQYVVRKEEHEGAPESVLARVEDAARVREIARMLSGAPTDVSMAHARELLAR